MEFSWRDVQLFVHFVAKLMEIEDLPTWFHIDDIVRIGPNGKHQL